MGMPLTEVENWDLDDIRHMNAVLDMRRDCEGAADAYQAAQVKKATAETRRGK